MPKYAIPLYSGIGNIIQSIPFANEMKRRYGTVVGFDRSDYPEAVILVGGILDKIYRIPQCDIPSEYTIAKIPSRRSYPEYKAWFIDNDEFLPENYSTEGIHSSLTPIRKHKYVLWPECKPNWLCKRWPYFDDLALKLSRVAVVGLDKDNNFPRATDYRGGLSLIQTGSVLKNADIFIGNEGGMAHYAAALGTKTYVISGCSDPVKNFAPNNMIEISLNLDCQPCQFKNMIVENKTAIGCHDRRCLNNLTVKNVLERIEYAK